MGRYSGHGCNSHCSLEKINQFWSDCCCVRCADGIYQNLPDGISDDDPLAWWTCCDVTNSYVLFLVSSLPLILVYTNFWFWYYGYAIIPTSIIELSKSTSEAKINTEGNRRSEYGPKTTLCGWRVVRNVSLHSKAIKCDEQEQLENDQEHQPRPTHVHYDYFATIELSNTQPIDIPLKSYDAYKHLEDYSSAREGKCCETTTKDVSHKTNGYHLISIGPESEDLFMYRPYFYLSNCKFECLFLGIPCLLLTIGFWNAAPTIRSFWIILFTNTITLLIGGICFHLFGRYGKGGLCHEHRRSESSLHEYVGMSDNPG